MCVLGRDCVAGDRQLTLKEYVERPVLLVCC